MDGNRYDYGCVQEGSSARCKIVRVVFLPTCTNNPTGCDFVLECGIGVSVHCAEECASDEMLDGRCVKPLAPELPPPVTCPNNIIDSNLGEVCDGSNLAGQTCASKGFTSGTLKCSSDCKSFDTSSCTKIDCPNNKIDKNLGEVCDSNNLDGQDCVKQGFSSGTLKCSSDCKSFDKSSCISACNNNNIVEGNEQCDGADF